MADRLISADALLEKVNYFGGVGFVSVNDILLAPTIEPKHGRWFYDEDGWWHCSECLAIYPDEITDEINYCPICGSDMREVEE